MFRIVRDKRGAPPYSCKGRAECAAAVSSVSYVGRAPPPPLPADVCPQYPFAAISRTGLLNPPSLVLLPAHSHTWYGPPIALHWLKPGGGTVGVAGQRVARAGTVDRIRCVGNPLRVEGSSPYWLLVLLAGFDFFSTKKNH
jgi:hypothetical protein